MVTFDAENKLIIVNEGITSLSIKEVYSEWKVWSLQSDNLKYGQILSVVGGEPLMDNLYLGTTYFLESGWRIRPAESNHQLNVTGNVYTREGDSPFTNTVGSYNVLITISRSNLIDTVSTSGSDLDATEIANAIWNKTIPDNPVANTFGEFIATKLLTFAHFFGFK